MQRSIDNVFGFGRLRANSALDSPQAAANAAYAGRRPSLPDPDLMPPTPPPRKSKGGGRPSSAGSGSGSGGPSTVELKPKRLGSKMSLLGLFKRPSADAFCAYLRDALKAQLDAGNMRRMRAFVRSCYSEHLVASAGAGAAAEDPEKDADGTRAYLGGLGMRIKFPGDAKKCALTHWPLCGVRPVLTARAGCARRARRSSGQTIQTR